MRGSYCALGCALLATPLFAESEIGQSPVLDQGSVTCAERLRMGLRELVREWSEEVATACDGHPDRILSRAATEALGTD